MNPHASSQNPDPSYPLHNSASIWSEDWMDSGLQTSKPDTYSGVGESRLEDDLRLSENLARSDWPMNLQTQPNDLGATLAINPLKNGIGVDSLTGQPIVDAQTSLTTSLATAVGSDSLAVVTEASGIRDVKDQSQKLWGFEGRAGGTTTYEFAIGPNGAQADLFQQAEHVWQNGEAVSWSMNWQQDQVVFTVAGQTLTYPIGDRAILNALSFLTKVNTTNDKKVGEGATMALTIESVNGKGLEAPIALESVGPNQGQDLDQLLIFQEDQISTLAGTVRLTWPANAPNPYLENSQSRVTFEISGYHYGAADTTVPELTLISPVGSGVHSGFLHLVGTASEAGALSATLDNTTTLNLDLAAGEFDQLLQDLPLSQGSHQLALTFTDLAGNASQQVIDFEVSNSPFLIGANSTKGWAVQSNETIVLGEADSFVVQASETIALGQSAGKRTLRFAVNTSFDQTDRATASTDRFAVYLVDANDQSKTLLDNGAAGTPFFALSGDTAEYTPGLVGYDGQFVEVDLTRLETFTEGVLLFQVLNQDGDTGSWAQVKGLTNTVDLEGSKGVLFPVNTDLATVGGEVDLSALTLSDQISVQFSHVRFQPQTGEYTAELRLQNEGSTSISRQAAVVFANLPQGVTLQTPSGIDAAGAPYLNLREAIRPGGLAAGERSDAVMVAFNNPELLRLAFQPQVYVSGPNQAPVLDALGSFEVMPGRTLEIPLNATDPDGDRVTFSLRSDTDLPMGELDGTSKLVFTPRPDQVGEYTFTLVATDGAEEVTQTVTLNVVADPDTTTRISGRVLDTLGNALANTRISLGAAETFTDTDGYFTIIPVDGADALKIFGNEYTGSPGEEFPFVAEKLPLVLGHDLYAGVNNVIDRPIYLPALDLADNSQTTDAAGNITVTNDVLKAEVLVAANSLIDPQGNPFTGTLSISDVPPDLTPAALPTNLSPDLVVTIQPGDMEFTEPAQLTLPNQAGWASGAEMDLWSINPTTGEFETVGRGRVSADGSVIETIEGGIRNSSWHFFVPPKVPYTARKEEQGCETCETKGGFSSDVSLNTGAVTETHTLAPYQSLGESRGVQLVYDSLRADPRPIVQFSYDNLDINSLIPVRLQNNSRLVASLSIVGNGIRYQVPGYQGDLIGLDEGAHFWRLPESADPVAGALQADLRDFASGVYQYSLSSGIYTQPRSDRFVGRSTNNTGELVHVNTVDSAWGSGWGVAGVQELIETRDGSVLLIDGDGTELLFKIDSNGVYQAPPGDFSSLERLSDGTFRRTDKDQTVYTFDANNRLVSMVDRHGNQTEHQYNAAGQLTKIIDPMGLETTFAYNAQGKVKSITDPTGRITELSYDSNGNLTNIQDPDTTQRTFQYDSGHHMTGEIDQLGVQEVAAYDFAGRAIQAVGKDGSLIQVKAAQTLGLSKPEDTLSLENAPVLAAIDENNRAVYANGNGEVSAYQLDNAGQTNASVDGVGDRSVITRNQQNLVTQTVSPAGLIRQYEYDNQGNVVRIVEGLAADPGNPSPDNGPLEFGDWIKTSFAGGLEQQLVKDLNNDGRADIIYDGGSVLLSNGNGTFELLTGAVTPDSTADVAVEDFNGDGQLDLLSQGEIRFGNGDGTFGQPFGGRPSSPAAIGDLDGDGDIDVLDGGSGVIKLNNGNGSFTQGEGYEPLNNLTLADVNGDGVLDIVGFSGNLTVLLGNGDGTFGQSIEYANIPETPFLVVADLNGDNSLDIYSETAIYWNDGVGGFQKDANFAPQNIVSSGSALGDLDRDGDVDIIDIHDPGAGSGLSLTVRLNDGQGNFAETIEVLAPAELSGLNSLSMATGDVNGDGYLDLLLGSEVGQFVSLNQLISQQLKNGRQRRYTYDSVFSQLTSMRDELGRQTLYELDSAVNGETDDVVTRYTYTTDGLMDRVTDALGRVTDYDYDRFGNLSQITFAQGTTDAAIQKFEYDAAGNQTAVVDEKGNRTEYLYDALNRVEKIIQADPDGTGPLTSPTTWFVYDQRGNLLSTTDANNNETQYEYDSAGRLVRTLDALGNANTYEYDQAGRQVAVVDPLGRRTESRYDTRGRLIETLRADGSVVKSGYDIDNNRTQQFDPNGNLTRTVYDEWGRMMERIDALGNTTKFEYDVANQLIAQIDANGNRTEYQYDDLGRRVAVIDAFGKVSRTEYDKVGNVIAEIDELGHNTEYQYDGRDRRTTLIDPLGAITKTTYDAVGNILSITDAVDNTTSYTYDNLNRLTGETNALDAARIYGYDAMGNRISVVDRNNRERNFVYDALNRQIDEQWLNGSGDVIRRTQAIYDAAGQLSQISDPDSTYRFTYDALGRQITIDNAGTANAPNVVLSYTYDAAGNILSVSDTIDGQTGGSNEYKYDVLNRVEQITQSGNGVSDKRVDFGYDPLGQFKTINRYSDLAGASAVVESIYTYDANNRLERLSHNNSLGEAAFYAFTYDDANRITAITDVDGSTDYGYNNRNELTGADHTNVNKPDETYTYDDNGNRVSSSLHGNDYVTGTNNQLQADGTYTYDYDPEGNLIRQTETTTGGVRRFEWDYLNRLVAVIDEDSTGVEVQRVEYTYDVMGRRIAKTVDVDGAGSTAAETLHFIYDRDNVLLEFEGNDTSPSQRYLHGPQVDQILAQEDNVGAALWHLSDHLGTVKDLVDDTGAVVNHRTYDSYGNLIAQSDESFSSRYGFTGREFDQETGLHYYRARYYNAEIGSFISEDPIAFRSGETQLYSYVSQDPVNQIDPNGEESIQLTALLSRTRMGNSDRVRIHEPDSPDYESAFITSTVWFWLITEGPDTRGGSSRTVPWNVTAPLIGGGRANHRPLSSSQPSSPTIDLLEEKATGITHNTPGYRNVEEIKFQYSGELPDCIPDPVLLRRREEQQVEQPERQVPIEVPEFDFYFPPIFRWLPRPERVF